MHADSRTASFVPGTTERRPRRVGGAMIRGVRESQMERNVRWVPNKNSATHFGSLKQRRSIQRDRFLTTRDVLPPTQVKKTPARNMFTGLVWDHSSSTPGYIDAKQLVLTKGRSNIWERSARSSLWTKRNQVEGAGRSLSQMQRLS